MVQLRIKKSPKAEACYFLLNHHHTRMKATIVMLPSKLIVVLFK